MNHKRELVKEDRWSRVYQSDQSAYAYESKFANEETSLTALQLALEWASWDDSERLRFANAYRVKPQVTADDERILEHLMLEGDRRVRATVASFLTCHSNKELVLELLLKELLGEPEFAPNFLNALAILGDYRAVPAVREFLERTLSQLEQSRDRTSRDLTMALICASRPFGNWRAPRYTKILSSHTWSTRMA